MSQGTFTDEQVHLWLAEVQAHSWFALHYDSPTLGGINNNEISGAGYSRLQAQFSAPANRSIWLLQDLIWGGLNQTQLSHFSVMTAVTGGRMVLSGRLPTLVTILNGRGYQIKAGELVISVA